MISDRRQRDPLPGVAVARARAVLSELGLKHPTEIEIEAIAHARGALVRAAPTRGARANLLRMGDRAIISVDDLPTDQRRWAIAHELGHFEAHPNVNYLGFCTGDDLRADYTSSGREPEANAFAAELLMPEHLYRNRVDGVTKVSWDPVTTFASEFQVSMTAAALRFVSLTGERLALYVCKDGKVAWSSGTRDFGRRLPKGSPLSQWSLASDYFTKGRVPKHPETVSADAWAPNARDGEEVVEHALEQPSYRTVMSLVWFPPR
jgi:hypothetical protein